MKIVAFSDLHRDATAALAVVDKAKTADIVVGAGDFATQGKGASETLDILRRLHCPFVLVHGNHDDPEELRGLTDGWPSAYLLHGTAAVIDGVTFFGVGGEVPPRHTAAWNVAQTEGATAALLKDCPEGAILVTHTPPFGHCDVQRDASHEGSKAILDCIERTSPVHALCGHIHHAWGMRSTIGKTEVANLGPEPVTLHL